MFFTMTNSETYTFEFSFLNIWLCPLEKLFNFLLPHTAKYEPIERSNVTDLLGKHLSLWCQWVGTGVCESKATSVNPKMNSDL